MNDPGGTPPVAALGLASGNHWKRFAWDILGHSAGAIQPDLSACLVSN